MPVQRGVTTWGGKRVGYYRWGDSGYKYMYPIGDKRLRRAAQEKAQRQGAKIKAGGKR